MNEAERAGGLPAALAGTLLAGAVDRELGDEASFPEPEGDAVGVEADAVDAAAGQGGITPVGGEDLGSTYELGDELLLPDLLLVDEKSVFRPRSRAVVAWLDGTARRGVGRDEEIGVDPVLLTVAQSLVVAVRVVGVLPSTRLCVIPDTFSMEQAPTTSARCRTAAIGAPRTRSRRRTTIPVLSTGSGGASLSLAIAEAAPGGARSRAWRRSDDLCRR